MPDPAQQPGSERGGGYATSGALKEPGAQLLFEFGNTIGQGRLGDTADACRATK